MNMLCPFPGCDVEQVLRLAPNSLVIVAHHRRDGACCPNCGTFSTSVHGRYDRQRWSNAERAASADSRARRLAAYEEVRRRYLAGETLQSIGRTTGLARGTVRKYAHAETFPDRAAPRPNSSRLDPYLA